MAATNPVLRVRDVCALSPILKNVDALSITPAEMMKLAKKWRMEKKVVLSCAGDFDNATLTLINQVNALPDSYADVTDDEMVALFTLMYANRAAGIWNAFCDELKKGAMPHGHAVLYLSEWMLNKGLLCAPLSTRVLDRFFVAIVERLNASNVSCLYNFNVIYSKYACLETIKQWTSVFEFNGAIRDMFLRHETITVVDGAGIRYGQALMKVGFAGSILHDFVKYGNKLANK